MKGIIKTQIKQTHKNNNQIDELFYKTYLKDPSQY